MNKPKEYTYAGLETRRLYLSAAYNDLNINVITHEDMVEILKDYIEYIEGYCEDMEHYRQQNKDIEEMLDEVRKLHQQIEVILF